MTMRPPSCVNTTFTISPSCSVASTEESVASSCRPSLRTTRCCSGLMVRIVLMSSPFVPSSAARAVAALPTSARPSATVIVNVVRVLIGCVSPFGAIARATLPVYARARATNVKSSTRSVKLLWGLGASRVLIDALVHRARRAGLERVATRLHGVRARLVAFAHVHLVVGAGLAVDLLDAVDDEAAAFLLERHLHDLALVQRGEHRRVGGHQLQTVGEDHQVLLGVDGLDRADVLAPRGAGRGAGRPGVPPQRQAERHRDRQRRARAHRIPSPSGAIIRAIPPMYARGCARNDKSSR